MNDVDLFLLRHRQPVVLEDGIGRSRCERTA
jgi:hypothetical protein